MILIYVEIFQFFLLIKYIFCCIHHISVKSNDKLINAEEQILLISRQISSKTSGFRSI